LIVPWLSPSLATQPHLPAAAANGALYPSDCDRFGVGVNRHIDFGTVADYDVARLGAGWYVDWGVQQEPLHTAGLDYMQMVQVSEDTYSPDKATLAAIVDANPGATWLIGNEPDSIYQGDSTPEQYAAIYHELYTFLKARDPAARVTVGGIVQATDLRLQWLDAVLDAHQALYGAPLAADLWNIHTFILREERGEWGADIPPGIDADHGELWSTDDHDDLDLLAEQVVRFRQWMQDHGEREKPLIVSEYGILLPDWLGFDETRVRAYMTASFDYFMTAQDSELGYPADGNRLVQRWAWYSLNDERFEGNTSHSHLFDPDTQEITALGLDYESYTNDQLSCSAYVDLLPVSLTVSPAQPLAPNGTPITITLTAAVRNAGNTGAASTALRFWECDPGNPIGETQPLPALAARTPDTVSVVWQGVSSGVYTVGVTVDIQDLILESNEGNNQLSRDLLVAGHVTYLPLVLR
jgi:hypothetical protein